MKVSAPEPSLTAAFRARGVPLDPFGPKLFVPRHFGDPLAEQRATRTAAGLYDFSFMACFEARGPQALSFLHRLQTRSLEGLAPGRLAYTLLLRDDGSVFIDATVWRLGEGRYWIVTGRRSDIDHVGRVAADFDVQIQDRSGRDGVIALQGPASAALLRRCGAGALPGYFAFLETRLFGEPCRVARIGYTGELGYEIFVDRAATKALWEGLVDAGRSAGLAECGFAAADALRVEAGFILFSRELADPATPQELGLGRLLSARKRYLGAAALARRPEGKRLTGLLPEPRFQEEVLALDPPLGPPAPGLAVLTSATFSALFGRTLAMGFVHPEDRYPGTRVRLGPGLTGHVARLPFYDPLKRLPRAPVDG
ncbi:MAG: aminomethyltransferase family protein [Pseudomonadota bacterium]